MENEITSKHVNNDWFAYLCKSGQTLFYYNKRTAEHRWTICECDVETSDSDESNKRQERVELKNVGTQTENNAQKTYRTREVETEINGVDSNDELTSLLTLAHNVCQKKTHDEQTNHDTTYTMGGLIGSNTDVDHSTIQDQTNHDMACKNDKSVWKETCENVLQPIIRKEVFDQEIVVEPVLSSGLDSDYTQEKYMNVETMTVHTVSQCMDTIDSTPAHVTKKKTIHGKSFNCVTCRKTFRNLRMLRDHTKTIHYKQNKSKSMDLKKHENHNIVTHTEISLGKILTPNSKKPYECRLCYKVFTHKSYLERHLRTHTGEKPYKCSLCHKAFSCKSALKVHQRTHTGEKPYECKLCHKRFTRKGSLEMHLPIHTGEKPYECSLCHKAFAQKSGLNMHLRTHTGEKPYECSLCHRAFLRKAALRIHIQTHTGEKPYECNLCHRAFLRKAALHGHLRTHTGEKPYECSLCHKAFAQKGALKVHQRTHTSEKPHMPV